MNDETRTLISWWMIKAKRETDPFIKFFILYMCLDAWITAGSMSDSDAKKLQWLKESENPLKEYWPATPHIKVPLQGLIKIGSVEDMRPNHRGEHKYLNESSSFGDVIDFIYQIRCNLFHGGKSYINKNDKTLSHLSAKIVENWIEWALLKTRN